jgi:hypothetical protein
MMQRSSEFELVLVVTAKENPDALHAASSRDSKRIVQPVQARLFRSVRNGTVLSIHSDHMLYVLIILLHIPPL